MTKPVMSKGDKEDIANRLTKLMDKKGWSQVELAEILGVSKGTITLWLQGERSISGSALKLLELYEKNKIKG